MEKEKRKRSPDERKRKSTTSDDEVDVKRSKKSSKDKDRDSKDKSKHKKHKSSRSKEKKSRDKHKGSSSHKHTTSLPPQEISGDDYFAKSVEFATWLKEEKHLFFNDLSSETARNLFSSFVKRWNANKLDPRYYEGISKAPRTAHKWIIKGEV